MSGLRRRIRYYGPGVVALVTAGFLLVIGPTIVTRFSRARTAMRVKQAREELSESEVLTQFNRSIQNIADAVEPSVVHITVHNEDYLFPLSTGSGWVYDDQGHVITNHHVLADHQGNIKNGTIEVQFHDGSRVRAELVGSDRRTDVAVLRVVGHSTVPAFRRDDVSVRQGDLVFAFGSPFGFQFSMSSGIVSGKGRFDRLSSGQGNYQSFIQTDAAINPGNSGGPLVNARGEVIGMNFAIAVDPNDQRSSGRAQYINSGVGLAIPLNIVEFVADQIIETGTVKRGGLGVSLIDLTRTWQEALNYHGNGLRIETVVPASPAEEAGLRRNDIIISVDGTPVDNRESFRAIAHAKSPGKQIVLGIWRGGEKLDIAVILSAWNDVKNTTTADPDSPLRQTKEFSNLGIVIAGLDAVQLKRLGFAANADGALYVQAMRLDAAGYDLGLRVGTIILKAGDEAITLPSDFAKILDDPVVRKDGIDLEVADIHDAHQVVHLYVPQVDQITSDSSDN